MLTIIIVAWNCREEVVECLRSLARVGRFPLDFETIVVDNASEDGTGDTLRSMKPEFRGIGLEVVLNSRNVGLSVATEQAFSLSKGDWILLCNPDIIFGAEARKLVSYGLSNPGEIIATEMTDYDGKLQRVIHRRFPTVTRVFFDFAFVGSYLDEKLMHHLVRRYYAYQDETFPPVASIDQPGASFLLLNRETIGKIGFIFDKQFPVWWNDVDLSKRAQAAGIQRTLLSEVKVRHGLGRSGSRRMPGSTAWHLFCRSMMSYALKWKMHPNLLRLLFGLDAIASVPVVVIVQSRFRGLRVSLKVSISHAAAQLGGVLAA